MSSGLLDDRGAPAGHPLVRFVAALEGLLDDAGATNAWTMTAAEAQALLPRITRATARLAEVELRVLRAADRHHAGDDVGATNTPVWWAHVTGQRVPAARATAVLAEQLDTDHETTRTAAPRHRRAMGSSSTDEHGQGVARPLRWGQAFAEYLETRDAACDGSPKAGGIAATVVVTATLEQLLGSLAGSDRPAVLDTGELVSAAQVRRLACEAGLIPAVLGSRSQPLDLGRKRRFHNEPQRIAMMLRDGGCAAVGCDWPPGMCHAHHKTPWAHGGRTSVRDGVLLCPRHHTLAHDSRYRLTTDRHGKVTFTKRM